MYKINDIVVYGTQGVCEISGIEERKQNGQMQSYFVLKSQKDQTATFFVPTWNEKALGKMRRVMTAQQINALIDDAQNIVPIWIDNDNERKEACRRILTSGQQAEIISMLHALYLHKKEREIEGKRLHMADEIFMKEAEQLLYHEWQYVLKLDKPGLIAYINERIQNRTEI